MRVEVAAKTDVGLVRQANEDAYLVQEPLYVVADGMGGHQAGEVASQITIDVLQEEMDRGVLTDDDSLIAAVKRANSEIWERSQSDSTVSGMGTTCTLVLIDGGSARFAHVGDSRAYLLRDGQLSQLTEDHTLVNRMVKEGRIRPEDAERHPQRNVITRALGIDERVEVDTLIVTLQPNDRVLLCSDGLSSMIGSEPIRHTLANAADADAAAEHLVRLALDAGGEDNITVVVLDVPENGTEDRTSAVPPPVRHERVETDPTPPRQHTRMEAAPAPRRRWLPKLIGWVVGLAVLGVVGYFVANYFISNSWFVGPNEDGFVAIFQGIPEEVGGLDLSDEKRTTGIALDDLPDHLRDEVQEGIKVDSEEDAEAKVGDLRRRVREPNVTPRPRPSRSPKN